MSELTIKTDNKWKQFKYRNEVPAKVLKDQFDYLSEDDSFDGFILYRKHWYHLSDFMRIENHPDDKFSSYHGYSSDSFFSGVLIKVSKDGEMYQIATYYS